MLLPLKLCQTLNSIAVIVYLAWLAVLPAQAAEAEAQSLQDLQQRIAAHPDYRDSMNLLYANLFSAIHAPLPRGTMPAPFYRFASSPDDLVPVLHEAMGALPAWQESDPAVLPAMLDLYEFLYDQAFTCTTMPLALPATLGEAAAQVETISADMVERYQALFSVEDARFLRENHALVSSMLQRSPYGGGLPVDWLNVMARFMDILEQADFEQVACAALHWDTLMAPDWQDNLRHLMQSHPEAGSEIIFQESTPFGQIIFGGAANHSYLSGNILFIADLDGNDIYALRTRDAWSGLPQLIIDFAGDDIFESQEPGGYASGIGSIAFLRDYEGNDTYHATALTQGFGLLGVGVLHDMAGDDDYDAAAMAQGMALYGVGLLLDNQGNDRYRVGGLAQGVGITAGLGMLADLEGNDTYLATGLVPTNYGTPGLADSWSQGVGVGVRFLTPGGVGILQDGSGRDDYSAGSFSQGGGYYHGLGLFRDAGTDNDNYLGARYNFGWGAHVGMAYFLEEGGDDYYRTRQFVSSGLAWDLSMVLFEDSGGNDRHDAGGFSLAASAYRSIILFHDHQGADEYRGIAPAMPTQGSPNLSLFLDSGEQVNIFDNLPTHNGPCTMDQGLSFMLVASAPTKGNALGCLGSDP